MTTTSPQSLEAVFRHVIYSPRGEIEGVLLEARGEPLQVVFERHDAESASAFEGIRHGQTVVVEVLPPGPSPKGEGEHPVHAYGRLVSIDGSKPAKPKADGGAAYQGRVVRLNHARHGAANGVVLDSGDFIHLKPEGMARLKLKVGDLVQADGDAQQLADASGWAVEATIVNGKRLAHH